VPVTPKPRYRLDGGSVFVRISASERQLITDYAHAESLPLGLAMRRLTRLGIDAQARNRTDDPPSESRHDTLLDIGLITLVAVEQVLRLLETLTPEGEGAGDAYLTAATHAAQARLGRSERSAREHSDVD
jgi:hypothetical protein